MNQYPVWKYILMAFAVIFGLTYTLPNFLGESPSIQVLSTKTGVKLDAEFLPRLETKLKEDKIPYSSAFMDRSGNNQFVIIRFKNKDDQSKAKSSLEALLNPNPTDPIYNVSLGYASNAPAWMRAMGAHPMYLGLDLKGGIHFLLQVDMKGALTKKVDSSAADVRKLLRDEKIDFVRVERVNEDLQIEIPSQDTDKTMRLLGVNAADYVFENVANNDTVILTGVLTNKARSDIQKNAVEQNRITLENRINELGVAEPVIMPQGTERIIVQLPGVQDISKAKEIIGRTATLEVRLADPDFTSGFIDTSKVPFTSEVFPYAGGQAVLKRQVLLTGDRVSGAQAGFDSEQRPAVDVVLDEQGGNIMRQISRENLKKPMAIVLFEKGKGEVLTIATIQSELGSRFQITGMGDTQRAKDLALLMRAGSLAAPMDIIEERTIGPSLGADNIEKGIKSMVWGFLAVSIFMVLYYRLFGVFSVLSLALNLLLMMSVLSLIQATLTLPGIAAMALTLGMAIDSNVLINERIREELRKGANPQSAIHSGYEHAWATIIDSNITSLIAGLALLAFGSGPIRGFAVVHCLGILTSMFSAVFFSRGLANYWYGGRKIKQLSIGQVWRPSH